MVGFLVFWLVNSTLVAVVAGFRSGEMGIGQWFIALAGGLLLNMAEARLFALLFGDRVPIYDANGRVIGGRRTTKGLLAAAREPVTAVGRGGGSGPIVHPGAIAGSRRAGTDPTPRLAGEGRAVSNGPWAAANVERDTGLFLKAVFYARQSPEVPATARAYANIICQSVTDGNDKALLVFLSGVLYFLGKVHFLREDPHADPDFVPYSRLLAAHFMNAASQALPGPNAPAEAIRDANAVSYAAEQDQASMALVEALGIVGQSAIDSVNRADN